MLKNDYIMRIIEQFISAMALILRYQKAEEYEKGLQTTGDTFTKIFGVGSDFFNSLSEQDLINLLKTNNILDKDKTIMIAALLKMEGDLFEAQKNSSQSFRRYHKSLNLYLESYLSDSTNARAQTISSDYYQDIEILIQKLEGYELPPQTKNRLWRYYEKEGKYARAEDLLYELYEGAPEDEIFQQGISFYERLLQKNDPQLNSGDLPRDEVEEGRQKWLTIKK